MTHNSLGNALQTLGERESVTAGLEEAVTSCRDTLLECSRERAPLDEAATQNNLNRTTTKLLDTMRQTARPSTAEAVREEFSSMGGLFM